MPDVRPCRKLFRTAGGLARGEAGAHVPSMFTVDAATAAAIRKAYDEGGELSAVVELRRHFPGITDNENARLCVRTITGWQPLPPLPEREKSRTRSSRR